MSEHPGSRGCYQKGCRALECRVANAAYMVVYRTKVRMENERLGAVTSGHQASLMVRQLRSEGFGASRLAALLGLSRVTAWRHTHSRPATLRTCLRVRRFFRQQQVGNEGAEG